jgi:hypothetical protein
LLTESLRTIVAHYDAHWTDLPADKLASVQTEARLFRAIFNIVSKGA